MITTGFIILYINAVIIITDQIQYLSLPQSRCRCSLLHKEAQRANEVRTALRNVRGSQVLKGENGMGK